MMERQDGDFVKPDMAGNTARKRTVVSWRYFMPVSAARQMRTLSKGRCAIILVRQ